MMGGSSVGMFSYYLASPFNLLLYFFGKEGVYRFFDVAVALKLATAGATFNWYLQRRFANRIRPVFVIALSMGYALMSYQIAQSSNIMWLDGVYMLPLILLGVYEVIHKKSVWRLVLTTAFCIFCNWYIAGICCLFSGIWFLFEFFFYDKEEDEIEDRKESSKKADSLLAADADAAKDAAVAKDAAIVKDAAVAKNIDAAKNTAVAKNNLSAKGMRASRSRGMYQRAHTPGILVGITDFVVSFCRYVWGMGLGVAMSAVLFLPVISAMRKGKGQYEEVKILMDLTGDLLSSVRG
jgi:uncharacterized membrane protein YfhO